MWRYSKNPVIGRYQTRVSNSIFNSAVVPFGEGYAGVFRCDNKAVQMNIFVGFSKDGINWDISDEPIKFEAGNTNMIESDYKYDPRVTWIEDRYWITWCNGYNGPTIGIGYTFDFKTFYQCENAFLPFNRNGVLFPQRFEGWFAMMSRPSDNGHTPFGDIFISQSPDLEFWGRHRHVMSPERGDYSAWQSTKIGAGSVPVETDEGWLLIYHGVINTCNGFVYRMGCALLDLEEPWKVKKRTRNYILGPHELYECVGDVPNVVFPCAALTDAATGRIAIYYGCADTVTGLAFGVSGVVGATDAAGEPLTGTALTLAAFETALGKWGGAFVSVCIALFAFATVIGWAYQGERAFEFLMGGKTKYNLWYRFAYGLTAFLGCVCPLEAVWTFSDICNGLMAVPNLICVLALSGKACREIREYEKTNEKKYKKKRSRKRL